MRRLMRIGCYFLKQQMRSLPMLLSGILLIACLPSWSIAMKFDTPIEFTYFDKSPDWPVSSSIVAHFKKKNTELEYARPVMKNSSVIFHIFRAKNCDRQPCDYLVVASLDSNTSAVIIADAVNASITGQDRPMKHQPDLLKIYVNTNGTSAGTVLLNMTGAGLRTTWIR
jgi:hypothetical protein